MKARRRKHPATPLKGMRSPRTIRDDSHRLLDTWVSGLGGKLSPDRSSMPRRGSLYIHPTYRESPPSRFFSPSAIIVVGARGRGGGLGGASRKDRGRVKKSVSRYPERTFLAKLGSRVFREMRVYISKRSPDECILPRSHHNMTKPSAWRYQMICMSAMSSD